MVDVKSHYFFECHLISGQCFSQWRRQPHHDFFHATLIRNDRALKTSIVSTVSRREERMSQRRLGGFAEMGSRSKERRGVGCPTLPDDANI